MKTDRPTSRSTLSPLLHGNTGEAPGSAPGKAASKRLVTGTQAQGTKPAALAGTPPRPPRKANWAAWRQAQMVPLRDAVALSLGFEPASVTLDHPEFASRLKFAVAQFRAKRILTVNMQPQAPAPSPSLEPVWLPHFGAWARLKPKWPLPPELAALAQEKLYAKSDTGPKQRLAARSRSWQAAVRGLADELHLRDLKAGTESSLKEIADRVAVEAARRSIHGPRGELSAQNILRAALQGGKWKRPKAARKGAAQAGRAVRQASTRARVKRA